jgi:hypothetical protein
VEVESSEVTLEHAAKAGCNVRALGPRAVGISFDETTPRDIDLLMSIFRGTTSAISQMMIRRAPINSAIRIRIPTSHSSDLQHARYRDRMLRASRSLSRAICR